MAAPFITLDAVWPILAVMAAGALIEIAWTLSRFAIARFQNRRLYRKLLAMGFPGLNELSGQDFERLLTELFREGGWKVEPTPLTNDGGADLVIIRDGKRSVVQAKRSRRAVGVKAVQEVVASMPRYRADDAIVVTNARFTRSAIRLAKENRVRLWDGRKLAAKLS